MFLNEQCKDAINMSDFLKTLQISADEIRRIGSMGQTEGMANIMISNLNKLDMFKRPMHCSDIQNETREDEKIISKIATSIPIV